MFNTFTRAQVQNLDVTPAQLKQVVDCCVTNPRRGVFRVEADCQVASHAWAQIFTDAPQLLGTLHARRNGRPRIRHSAPRRDRERAEVLGSVIASGGIGGSDAVISHRTAARIWGLSQSGPVTRWLEATNERRAEKTKNVWIRKAPLPSAHVVPLEVTSPDGSEVATFSVTTPERTVADLLRTQTPECGHVVLENFLAHVHPGVGRSGDPDRAGFVPGFHGFNRRLWRTLTEIPADFVAPRLGDVPISWSLDLLPRQLRILRHARVEDLLTGGVYQRPSAKARRTLERCGGRSGSPLEARIAFALRALGVTGWIQQKEFFHPETGELDARVDLWFEKQKAVYEADGQAKYVDRLDPTSGNFHKEKIRQNTLARYADIVLHLTDDDLAGSWGPRPHGLIARLRAGGIEVPNA